MPKNDSYIIENSRALRKNQTECETKLWNELRNRRFNNLKFRRQHRIGPYIVDFVCHEKKLIIELDGGQHNLEEGRRKDQIRTDFLEENGYKVLRFWNNEVLNEHKAVLEKIWITVNELPDDKSIKT